MTSEFSVDGARVVVVGAARSGVAAARLLARRGAQVVLSDIRDSVPEADPLRAVGVTLELGRHPEKLEVADLVVLSPGVSPRVPAIDSCSTAGSSGDQ